MNAIKMLAIVLIVAGSLGLLYGGFSYTKDTHQAKIGPIELSIQEKETVFDIKCIILLLCEPLPLRQI